MVPYWELIKFLPPLLSILWRGTECQKFYNRCEALGKYLQRFPMERLRLWFGRETLELLRTMLAACGEEKPWALLLCRDEQEIKHIIIDKPNYIADDLTDCHQFTIHLWMFHGCYKNESEKIRWLFALWCHEMVAAQLININ